MIRKYLLVIRRKLNNLNFYKGSFHRTFIWIRDLQEYGAYWDRDRLLEWLEGDGTMRARAV
jgi:hypothetical protein